MLAPNRPVAASPDVTNWVNRTLQRMLTEYSERNQMILGLRRQRFMRQKLNLPEAYQQFLGQGVRVPISYKLVETVVGAVAGEGNPDFLVSSPDRDVQQRATAWCKLIFEEQLAPIYYAYWDGLLADGLVAIKTQRRPWTDFPKQNPGEEDEPYNRRAEEYLREKPPVPWTSRIVDAACFIPPRSEWGGGVAAEIGLRPTEDVFKALGLKPSGTWGKMIYSSDVPTPRDMISLRSGPMTQVEELWTEKELYVRVAGNVYVYENDLGRLPYEWTSGSSIAFSDPTLQALSVLYPLQYLEPWVQQTLSGLIGNQQLASVPNLFIEHPVVGGQAGAGEPLQSDIPQGQQIDLPPGATARYEGAPIDQGSVALFNVMVQLAKDFTMSPTPTFAGTRTPGIVLSQAIERTTAVLKPRVEAAKRTWARQQKFYFDILDRIVKVPVVVSGMVFEERSGRSAIAEVALAPRDIRKIRQVYCNIKYQTTQDKIAWNTHSVLMQQSKVWSMERARRETGISDPEQEGQIIDLEDFLQNPVIKQYIMEQGLSGHPPLEALKDLVLQGQQELAAGGQANGAASAPTGPDGGRIDNMPRGPGGTGNGTMPTPVPAGMI